MDTLVKKSIRSARRSSVDLSHFSPVKESTLGNGKDLPLILEPAIPDVDLADWVRNNRAQLDQKLYKHGGFLYRGFKLETAEDFERVAAAICTELYADYGDLPKGDAKCKVYTSTWYPDDKAILYHQESSHFTNWPRKINFFSVTVAKEGGCSPVVDCRLVYRGLDPKVRDLFEQKGLKYIRNFSPGVDVPWQTFFHTNDKEVVNEHCRKVGLGFEWTHSGECLRLEQHCRAVAVHYATKEKIFFNQIQLHHTCCLDPDTRASLLSMLEEEDLPRQVYFGDGSEIPPAVMDHVGETYEKYAVRFQWQKGDMVTLDNMLVAHARDPFVGPRKILVALGDLITATELDRINQI
jgi:TfdA family taurine catabolism dioxygenase TauD